MPVLDPFKGGNHLPLFAALSDVQFTILCNRSKVQQQDLPPNVSVVTVPGRLGPYYYGVSDYRFASLVMKRYPVDSTFWTAFDVIHLNQVMGPAFCRLVRGTTPVVFLIHHPVTADRNIAVETTRGMERLCWRVRYFFLVRFQGTLCRASRHIATVSQSMRERISSDYSVSTEKIDVVPNGVNVDVFTLAKDEECTIDVIAVGSFIHPRKGFSHLIRLYAALAKKDISIADVGRRSDEQIAELQKIEGVTVYGTVPSEKLVELMRQARVLVSTSLFEGFGLSLIEALACGHPSFAFAVGAVPEVLNPVDQKLVVPAKDIVEMAKRVEDFLSLTTEQRDQKGSEYRRSVRDLWNMQKAAEELRLLYGRISNG